MNRARETGQLIILTPEDYIALRPQDFGMPEGVSAIEIIGPFAPIKGVGPLIMVHDGVLEPHLGLGHHPHRYNERLFYILEGAFSHDDALNHITGEVPKGGLARFTEGKRGMVHQEWNNTDVPARAFILVYQTDPIPETASFAVLTDEDAPRYQAAPGVTAKELVGPRGQFPVHGDIRLYTDNHFKADSQMELKVGPDEGTLLVTLEGEVELDGHPLSPPNVAIGAPEPVQRTLTLRAAGDSKLLILVFGPGKGDLRTDRA
jgi:redox-sensitive bicupin YhaK (pirin superfamily)